MRDGGATWVADLIKKGLEDVLAEDDSGNETPDPLFLDVDLIDEDPGAPVTLGVHLITGERYFVTVEPI